LEKRRAAWWLATAGKLNPAGRLWAIRLAREALEVQEPPERDRSAFLDTLGWALAGGGQFEEASQVQNEAFKIATDPERKNEYAYRWVLYRALAQTPGGNLFDPSSVRQTRIRPSLAEEANKAEGVLRDCLREFLENLPE
jgi:hypothetical protein